MEVKNEDDYVFPSPKGEGHLSTVRAWQIVKRLGRRLDTNLFDHWFRGMRASQLAEEYGFDLHQLIRFFNWKSLDTALHYAQLSTEALEKQMRPQW